MRLILCVIELGLVWLIYYLLALATSYELPFWLTALLVLVVDRCVGFIAATAKTNRAHLSK